MLGFFGHAIASPFVRMWLATSSQSWRQLPRPVDQPLVHAPGADSDRVLLIGSGIAVGYGVVSHDLALGGNLARELSTITGRGASMGIVAGPEMTPTLASTTLGAMDLDRFDALVFTLGGIEVMTLMPPSRWRSQIRDLLQMLDAAAPARLEIFFVATAAPLLDGLPWFYRNLVRRHAQRLNDQVRELARERRHTTMIEFEPEHGDLGVLRGRSTYQGWAKSIAPAVAARLEGDSRDRAEVTDEELRLAALAALDVDGVPGDEIEQLVATTRRLFDAAGASVTIIEGDRQTVKSTDGAGQRPSPREDAVCNLTIRQAELYVIEDALTDERLAGTSMGTGERFRFYAGYPLEAPDGHRIGALCITDRKPRIFSSQDAALLRDLALRVQSLLWVNVN